MCMSVLVDSNFGEILTIERHRECLLGCSMRRHCAHHLACRDDRATHRLHMCMYACMHVRAQVCTCARAAHCACMRVCVRCLSVDQACEPCDVNERVRKVATIEGHWRAARDRPAHRHNLRHNWCTIECEGDRRAGGIIMAEVLVIVRQCHLQASNSLHNHADAGAELRRHAAARLRGHACRTHVACMQPAIGGHHPVRPLTVWCRQQQCR